MIEHISMLLDELYEGVRDGHVTREQFGQHILRLVDMLTTIKIRNAVIDHETAQILLHATNLPKC